MEKIRNVWRNRTGKDLPKQDIPTVLSCLLTGIKDREGRPSPGPTRLHKILVVEAAHFIWTLRCERVINNNDNQYTPLKVISRWNKVLTNRAELDIKLTDKKLGKKAISNHWWWKPGKVQE